jgi:GNAT superfamily N-acetyltransferase
VIDWLQPDWVLELPQATFSWRELQRRPTIQVEIARCDKSWWKLFAPFHYLTASLVSSAKCFLLTANDCPAAFSAVKVFPHPKVKNIVQGSRAVVLPDWQGLGLAFVLREKIASAYLALGKRFRGYPAHPSFVHAHQRSKNWKQIKELGTYQAVNFNERLKFSCSASLVKARPCATFEYIGPKMENVREAAALIYGKDVFVKNFKG